jgi:hypothetical protein
MADKPDKCAHPSCNCVAVKDSKYCSTFCEGNAKTPDIMCSCGHAQCETRAMAGG